MADFFYYTQFTLLPIILFVLINWIGAHSLSYGYISMSLFVQRDNSPAYNIAFRVISPTIFIIIISSIYYSIKLNNFVHNIWYVTPIYFLLRITYNISLNKWQLINKRRELIIFLISSFLSLIIYNKFISIKTNLLPDPANLTGELWIIIILYLYNTFDKIPMSTSKAEERHDDYRKKYYGLFKSQFGSIVSSLQPSPILESLIYSVMIYENFNRPPLFRFFERLTFPLFSKTLGIMQVKTNKKISDAESISIGAKILQARYNSTIPIAIAEFEKQGIIGAPVGVILNTTSQPILEALKEYNKDDNYISGVTQLQEMIIKEFYPSIEVIW